jgi:hypothetical protein
MSTSNVAQWMPGGLSESVSLYALNAMSAVGGPGKPGGGNPPPPGTIYTAAVETVDNDCVPLMLDIGAIS